MPANLVTGANANDVATYIAKCSANATCGVTANGSAPSGGAGAAGGTTTTGGAAGGTSLAAGKKVFESAGCAGCHTLKDAGATGNIGPNLDQLKPAEPTVQHQVENGGGGMPAFKGQLSQQQIDAVSAYVAGVAGK
jgi:mono/diheme cytochrome c family protein